MRYANMSQNHFKLRAHWLYQKIKMKNANGARRACVFVYVNAWFATLETLESQLNNDTQSK